MLTVIIAGLMFVALFVLYISQNKEQRWFAFGLVVLAWTIAFLKYFNLI